MVLPAYISRRAQCGLVMLLSAIASGQAVAQPGEMPSRVRSTHVDSGPVAAPADGREVVWQMIVREPQAVWLRLHFDALDLPGSSLAGTAAELRMMSLADGGLQLLNMETAREWGRSSAFFNGDAVLLQLIMSAETAPARVKLHHVTLGVPQEGEPRSICGEEDDRVLWDDHRVARVLGESNGQYTALCTAWLVLGSGRDLLTAGHCVTAYEDCNSEQLDQLSVVEFNVPLSSPSGSPIFSDPSDQYVVDPASIQYWDDCSAIGDDWCYFGVFPNSITGADPLWQQGGYFALPGSMPGTDGSTIQVTGFGTDDSPYTHNQAQQAEWGIYDVVSGGSVQYDDLDTTGGASGAPIEKLDDGVAVGIHTDGGCHVDGVLTNFGTAIDNAGLQNALANPQGVCGAPVYTEVASRSFTVIVGEVRFREVASRAFTVVAGNNRFREVASRAVVILYDPDWAPCPGDIDDDGSIGVDDLLAVIAAWGSDDTDADLNEDGIVNVNDLLLVIAAWGPCP